jgi:hypothetical protein
VAPRIYEVLKENVKQDLLVSSNKDNSESVKIKEAENVFVIDKNHIKVDPDTGKIVKEDQTEELIQLCFMLLSNITANE